MNLNCRYKINTTQRLHKENIRKSFTGLHFNFQNTLNNNHQEVNNMIINDICIHTSDNVKERNLYNNKLVFYNCHISCNYLLIKKFVKLRWNTSEMQQNKSIFLIWLRSCCEQGILRLAFQQYLCSENNLVLLSSYDRKCRNLIFYTFYIYEVAIVCRILNKCVLQVFICCVKNCLLEIFGISSFSFVKEVII